MGAINFNPARVIEKLSREHPISRLAGGQGQNRPPATAADVQKREEGSANPANLLIREWLDGLSKVDRDRPPINFPQTWWRDFIRDAPPFLTTWSGQAANLGWTTLDLFGAHRRAPGARYSSMGLLLLLRGGRVIALTAESAAIEQQSGSRLIFTRRATEPDVVPVWDLPR